MRAPTSTGRGSPLATRFCIAGAMATAAYAAGWADAASAAAPPPCGGAPQVTDATGDGHHNNTDVVAAWLAEQSGRVQAVIQPRVAVWEPAHPDSDAAGFALLYDLGGQVRYVRAEAPREAPVRFDHGTWTSSGGFAHVGATTGEAVAGPGGTVTIDVPGILPGAVLARPFVLTYDGVDSTGPHWVDRAPGGVTPDGVEYGADFVAGSCAGPGGGGPQPGGGGATTTAVQLRAPRRLVGGGTATVGGRVLPARAGVTVAVTATARGARVRRARTQADGTFSLLVPIAETTRLRAVAEGIGSQTQTVTVRSKVRIRVRGAVVRGSVSPRLPGQVLLLRSGAVEPTARTKARGGSFCIRLAHPRPGRYQAVFIPSGRRAERSTSNTGVIR